MALNFPPSPSDQDEYNGYTYDATSGVWNKNQNFNSIKDIAQQTSSSYTLSISDANDLVKANNATGITVTVPKNSSVAFPLNTEIHIIQYGEGTVTFAPVDGDVAIRSTPGLNTRDQWSLATLIKIDTNEWVLTGDLVE
jgi:hypothetical protein